MSKEEWGTKRLCPKTGRRFYDLNHDPVISPYTGEVVDLESDPHRVTAAAIAEADRGKDVIEDDDLDADELLVESGTSDDDELLEEDDDDDISLEELADVAAHDDDEG